MMATYDLCGRVWEASIVDGNFTIVPDTEPPHSADCYMEVLEPL